MSSAPATADVERTPEGLQARLAVKLPAVRLAEVRKPVLASIGAADLAVEQARSLPALYAAELPKLQARLDELSGAVKTLPVQARELRGEVEVRVAKVQEQAADVYAELAVRGERLVTSVRRQPAREAAFDAADVT